MIPVRGSIRTRVRNHFFSILPFLFQQEPAFAPWRQLEDARRQASIFPHAIDASWLILTTAHSAHAARCLADELRRAHIRVEITLRYTGQQCDNYIVIAPQAHDRLPPHFGTLQTEQLNNDRWLTGGYIDILKKSDFVFEYSRANITILRSAGISYDKIFYLPIDLVLHDETVDAVDRDIDVLFFGDLTSTRRQRIVAALSRQTSITVINGVFGPTMDAWIRRAKCVLNIHYYDTSNLESERIFRCLSLGTPVVSESSLDIEDYRDLSGAVFISVNDNIETLADGIETFLSAERQAVSASIQELRARPSLFRQYFRRFLLSRGLCSYEHYFAATTKMNVGSFPRLCLTLPETPDRTSMSNAPSHGFRFFDGLRHTASWIGTGLSYRDVFRRLVDAGVDLAVIAEDDAVLPDNFDQQLSDVVEYLNQHRDEWDVFVGLVSDFHGEAEITKVTERDAVTFMWPTSPVGCVCNIYSRRAMIELQGWDYQDTDVSQNTIDRFMAQRGLRFVTCLPPLVSHSETAHSTLWGISNAQYAPLIANTEALLAGGVQSRRAKQQSTSET